MRSQGELFEFGAGNVGREGRGRGIGAGEEGGDGSEVCVVGSEVWIGWWMGGVELQLEPGDLVVTDLAGSVKCSLP